MDNCPAVCSFSRAEDRFPPEVKMKKVLIGFLIITVSVALLSGCGYNQLQQLEENVFRGWSDVDSTLQRRAT